MGALWATRDLQKLALLTSLVFPCIYLPSLLLLKARLPFFCFLMLVMMYVFHIRLRCVFAAVQGLWLGRAAATLQL